MSPAPPDPRSSAGFPELSADERAHSLRVLSHVQGLIAREGGWISFADYMSAVLYAPGLGYYAAGAHKLGSGGDFVTAPELTALFGQALAAQLEEARK
jgi:SAM-dependent MidA family methyltransferase